MPGYGVPLRTGTRRHQGRWCRATGTPWPRSTRTRRGGAEVIYTQTERVHPDLTGTAPWEAADADRGSVPRLSSAKLRTAIESGILWRVTADHTAVCAESPAIQLTNRTTVLRISQPRCCADNGTARPRTIPGSRERSS
ncbi:hypothetical protein HNR06_000425 [Nocardiopsis arvandica]|uniref:Uncharacterized protein n=1 Tax=Nocardiopsis sinuspersici TaxID=501010 RepID=A0A7Z0BHB4_9ACTN|nr:hypothetical protein [Nocardiopsis sinuspersici]